MPRTRPVQHIRQPNGNPNLPDTGSVVVTLGPETPQQIVYGSSTPYAKTMADPAAAQRGGPIPVEVGPEQRITPRSDAVMPPQLEDEGGDPLEELRASEKRARDRARAAETSAAQALQWGHTQATEAAQAKKAVTESNLDTVSSALAAAEQEIAVAEQAYADAWQKGDGLGVAKATRAMNDAQYRVNTLRAGKDELEQEVKKPAAVSQAPPSVVMQNVDLIIGQWNLLPEERDWIREHPDSVTDQMNLQRLRMAFVDSEKRGIKRGSDEYFEFFNDRLGYDDQGGGADNDDEPPIPSIPARRQAMPQRQQQRGSMPVRATRQGNGQPVLREGQIMLSEEQRRAAKMSGVDEVTYARGVQRLMEGKKAGIYASHETK